MNDLPINIQLLLKNLYHENAGEVKHALEEIGRVGKGNHEAMKALQEFLGRERRTTLRILAAQTISKIKEISQLPANEFKKPGIFQCPGAEKIKRTEIIDVTCPHCHKEGTASVAGFENEFVCESCGKMIARDLPESCIEKCPVGSACVGEERYQKYLKGRKQT
ncbi:MAG TPA: hypothetical protein ACFYEK_08805 [Candidatus Wunengus sp. YC60]|uniref:hypothetical protein n=1 Tax=Candidatus Wunengus sp. YC60 TaxID=3367697 RepID=UPI0040256B38